MTNPAQLLIGQVEMAERLTDLLQKSGPWALLTLALMAIAWLAYAYIKARDERDTAVSELNKTLIGLLGDVVKASEQQKAGNDRVLENLDRIERRLENVRENVQ